MPTDKPAAPASVAEFEARLLAQSAEMPRRLRQCAEVVAERPDRIAVSTVAEMAAMAGVQPSAFVRFCQLMGFPGYTALQRLYRDAYAPRWPDYRTRLDVLRAEGTDSPSALLAEFVDAGRHSLDRLTGAVDPEALERATAALAAAHTIHLAGFRRSFPVASYMAYALEKMEIPAMLHDGVGRLDHGHALRDGDALVAITFTPYTPQTVELAATARARGLPVVAITDGLTSPLRRLEVIALSVPEVDVGSFRALTATHALAIALVVAVGARRRAD